MTPYFPVTYSDAQKYQCPGCRGWFYHSNTSCCVAHPPGTCCHHYEEPAMSPYVDPHGPSKTPSLADYEKGKQR